MPAPQFSILIPLYNEQDNLIPNVGRLMLFLARHGVNAEILLGSNGSTDATVSIGKMLEETFPDRIRFFHVAGRGRVGQVFARATAMASSPYLLSLDIDLPIGLDFIPIARDLLERNDIVVGSKMSGSQQRSFHRLLGSGIYIFCTQVFLGLPYDDYSIGAKAYALSRIRPLLDGIATDTNYVLDILLQARREGMRIAVVSVACSDWRSSRFRLFREGLTRFRHLFRIWFAGLSAGE